MLVMAASASSRFNASKAAQAVNAIIRMNNEEDKAALVETLEDYFFDGTGQELEDLESMNNNINININIKPWHVM